jgi:excisionase family DNA binding protein
MKLEFYSPEQVAERLGLHVRTVRNYVREGRLRAVRIGKQYRIAQSDLANLTGQPASSLDPTPEPREKHVEVSSIVEIDGVTPETASRISTLVVAASNAPRGNGVSTRIEVIYDERREHLKVVLVGTMENNALFFNFISGVLNS